MKDYPTKVLIAESNDLSRFIIEKMMSKRGIHTVTVSNFDAAIYEMQRHQFELVLFDARFAELQDTAFIKEMNSALNAAQIESAVLTNGSHTSYALDWVESGFNHKLEKPIPFDALDTLLNNTLFKDSVLNYVVAK